MVTKKISELPVGVALTGTELVMMVKDGQNVSVPASLIPSLNPVTEPPLVRPRLQSTRTYYVSKTGSDTNDGLTTGTSFLTIQHAADTVTSFDFASDENVYVYILVGDGIYEENLKLRSLIGAVNSEGNAVFYRNVDIIGNETNPSAVVLKPTGSVYGIFASGVTAFWHLSGFKLDCSTVSNYFGAVRAINGAQLSLGAIHLKLISGVFGFLSEDAGTMVTVMGFPITIEGNTNYLFES